VNENEEEKLQCSVNENEEEELQARIRKKGGIQLRKC
jgi:hypothetical protein